MTMQPPPPPGYEHQAQQPAKPPIWKRKWAIAVAVIAALMVIGALTSGEEAEVSAGADPVPQQDAERQEAQDAPTPPERAEAEEAPDAPVASIPASPTIAGCDVAPDAIVERITTRLNAGLELGLAYVLESGQRQIVGASIYRTSDGNRVSSADTWIIEGGTVYALSGSANEYTGFEDARDLPDRPSAGDSDPTRLIDDCLIPAIRGG